jgi:hypothetical protein
VACLCRFTGAENVNRRKPPPLPAELPSGLLSWIGPIWRYPENDVINLCGLDVAVYFRLLNLGKMLALLLLRIQFLNQGKYTKICGTVPATAAAAAATCSA